ncbi:type II restriction endonuclease [Mesorhizobium sp. M0894]|uniref:type II restriction endonuclease n=1 Tax=unclassified Mesorhizobium TaxID=325217 RepID=UPI00333DA071
MSSQTEFSFEQNGADAELLTKLFEKSDRILVKKLSNNDRLWAHQKEDDEGRIVPGKKKNNQAGVYIPQEERDGGFFPPLAAKDRRDLDADEIREAWITTRWPQSDEERTSRLVHYTSKGQETHLTRLPRTLFAPVLPASFLVMGRVSKGEEYAYECLTIDSGSDEAGLLIDLFALDADFLIGVFEPATRKAEEREKVLDFAEQLIAAWLGGGIAKFASDNAVMPVTADLARLARTAFLQKHSLESMNPFALPRPGDALREISRSIEWELFREFQRRERSVELVRLVLGDSPRAFTASEVIRRLIDEYQSIDARMLSASQQRKSRAGYSYEHHIEAMLRDGSIPFEKQVIIEAKKRPDFILPSLAFIDSGSAESSTGLILSAKTTLRERWKQVEREKGSRRLFLTSVDENIAGNAINDMASFGVHLVIPESLMESRETEYAGHANVLSFRDFCADFVEPHLASWAC